MRDIYGKGTIQYLVWGGGYTNLNIRPNFRELSTHTNMYE